MSAEHAFLSFEQRDSNITKQRLSASKDLRSVLDNNPNVRGRESQFEFDFMLDEPKEQVVETVRVSRNPQKPR